MQIHFDIKNIFSKDEKKKSLKVIGRSSGGKMKAPPLQPPYLCIYLSNGFVYLNDPPKVAN